MTDPNRKTEPTQPAMEMTAEDVLDFYNTLERMGIEIRIDGGWAVDALLGEQTRRHGDLDIIIEEKDVPAVLDYLRNGGFGNSPRPDTCPANFVYGDAEGHEIDFHVIVYDADGNGILGPPERGTVYPAESLTGTGIINGKPVRCITARYSVIFHTGYEPRDYDFRDVRALCSRFGIEIPKEYK